MIKQGKYAVLNLKNNNYLRTNFTYSKSCLHRKSLNLNSFRSFNALCKNINSKRIRAVNDVSLKLQNALYSSNVVPEAEINAESKNNDFTSDIEETSSVTIIGKDNVHDTFTKLSKNQSDNISRRKDFKHGPSLTDFISKQSSNVNFQSEHIPYLNQFDSYKQRVFLEIYGCQMNVNDAEIIAAILTKNNYIITKNVMNAHVILLVTCAIRENAENKVWHKLNSFKSLKKIKPHLKIGLLGCMAERLKYKLVETDKIVDIISGPDSYKDLPRLLAISKERDIAINVALSLDETYADVTPVRMNPNSKTAFVSIMRGCDNMCTYCIVPFTRGRERSRPLLSILDEVQHLSNEGIKEVTLLGQNVNSYRDVSESNVYVNATKTQKTNLAKGFKTVYKLKEGGLRFSDLLDKVSLINPEMRIRFTSPHPKDFPDEVIQLISERPNICNAIHLPAQSGSTDVLTRMRRGYTRESYLDLVHHIRSIIPNVALSSDFIAGFCNETEEEFEETLSLIEEVKYTCAYLFAYSMREKTTAYRRYSDNVDKTVKQQRLQKMISLYRAKTEKLYLSMIGKQQLVLVEGESKRSARNLQGRTDGNIKVIFSDEIIPSSSVSSSNKSIKSGDYVVVHIYDGNSQGLKGIPLYHSSISEFNSGIERLQAYY